MGVRERASRTLPDLEYQTHFSPMGTEAHMVTCVTLGARAALRVKHARLRALFRAERM